MWTTVLFLNMRHSFTTIVYVLSVLFIMNRYYSDLSLWDIHRTQAPLLTLLRPDVASSITHSLLYMYEQGGALPRWPIANGNSMSRMKGHPTHAIFWLLS